MKDRAEELNRMQLAAEEYAALGETVARITQALPTGVPLRSLQVMAEARAKLERVS